MRAIFYCRYTDGIKLFRSISDMVCLETPACLASCVWFKPSRARNSFNRLRTSHQLLNYTVNDMRLFDNYICQIYTKKYDYPPMYDILKQTPQRLQVIIVYFRYTFLHN